MRLFAVLLLTALPSFAAPAFDVLLPPKANAVFGLRAGALLNLIAEQDKNQELRQQVGFLMAASPFSGFDPFRDIHEVIGATTGTGKNPPSLIIVTGNFDPAKVANGKGLPYRNATLIQQGTPQQVLGILDEHTLLLGDATLVRAAIDRAASSGAAATPIVARIEPLRTKYDFWAIADALEAANLPTSPQALNGVDRLWFGMAFTHNFEIAAEVHLKSAKDVETITGMLREVEQQLKSQLKGEAVPALELHTSGNSVTMAMSVPEAEWKKALQDRMQQGPGAQTAPGMSTKPAIIQTEPRIISTEPAAQPRPQVITTDGVGNTVTLTLPVKRP